MNNPSGRIITVTADAPTPLALVEIDATVECPRCRTGKGCGAGLLASGRSSRRVEAIIGPGLDIREGDEVRVALAPANLLRAALLVYGTPLFAAVAGAALAFVLGLGELFAAMAALGGVFLGIAVARRRLQNTACLRDFTPTIVAQLQAGS